jgi:hypothetical protein
VRRMVLSVPFKSSFEYIGQIYIVLLCIKRVVGRFSVFIQNIYSIQLTINEFKFL